MPYYPGKGIVNPDLHAPQTHKKDEVNYRHYESCKTCAFFNGRVGCKQVQGNVSPEGLCNLWNMTEGSEGLTNKEYFERAYENSTSNVQEEE